MLVMAVLSDIHSNYVALEKCLEHAVRAGADTFVFLGDYAGDFAYPRKTMDLLYALKEKYRCFFVSFLSPCLLKGSLRLTACRLLRSAMARRVR